MKFAFLIWPIVIITHLEVRLWPNILFTLWGNLVVFTRSAITLPKVNRFGWNLEHSEYIVGGWPWQILSWARQFERQTNFFCLVSSAQIHRFHVCNISWNLNTIMSIGDTVKTFGTEFWKFYRKGSFLPKNPLKMPQQISKSCDFRPP